MTCVISFAGGRRQGTLHCRGNAVEQRNNNNITSNTVTLTQCLTGTNVEITHKFCSTNNKIPNILKVRIMMCDETHIKFFVSIAETDKLSKNN